MNKHALAAASLITIALFFAQQLYVPPAEKVFVKRVIDGDTFEADSGNEVRILGINTPEKKQYLYANATAFLKNLIEGKNVTLERDKTKADKYGRQLRYVFLGGTLVEEEILKKGLANSFIIPPNEKYSKRLLEAERHAKENRLGLWNASNYSSCVSLAEFHWDASGDDSDNLNGEYVSFSNGCGFGINMSAWTLKNSGTRIYKFRNFTIMPGASVTVRSGCGPDSQKELFWCGKNPVWNNGKGALYLRDSEGLLVISESYDGNG